MRAAPGFFRRAAVGQKHVITETFACAGWDVTPKELKRIAEWQYVNGVNQMCQHLYPYSIRGQRKRDYPAFYSEHNPWVKAEFRAFNDYFTALGCMLADSREEAPVAIVHPIHAAYLTYKHNDPHSVEALDARAQKIYELREKMWEDNKLDMREFERVVLLSAIDHHWMDTSTPWTT